MVLLVQLTTAFVEDLKYLRKVPRKVCSRHLRGDPSTRFPGNSIKQPPPRPALIDNDHWKQAASQDKDDKLPDVLIVS